MLRNQSWEEEREAKSVLQCWQIAVDMGFNSLKLADLELKGEQKAALNAVVSKTIASPSNILPTRFVVLLLVDLWKEKVRNLFVTSLHIR